MCLNVCVCVCVHARAHRTTVQCLVFGPPGCGKTSLLRACVGMRPDGPPTTTTGLSNAPKAPFGSPAGKPGSFGAVLGIEEEGSSGARGPGGLGGSSAEEAMRMGAGDASWTSVALVKGPDDKERTLVLHEVSVCVCVCVCVLRSSMRCAPVHACACMETRIKRCTHKDTQREEVGSSCCHVCMCVLTGQRGAGNAVDNSRRARRARCDAAGSRTRRSRRPHVPQPRPAAR